MPNSPRVAPIGHLQHPLQSPAWLCTEWLSYFGRTRKAAQAAPSPWQELRGGLVLGGKALWEKARRALADSEDNDEIRRSRRAGAEALAKAIDRLSAEQSDRSIAIWLEVRHGGRRMTEVAKLSGHRDGSGADRVVQRLEARAKQGRQLQALVRCLPRGWS